VTSDDMETSVEPSGNWRLACVTPREN